MRLNQVTLKAGDVGACTGFYERLGFRLIVDSRPRYVRFECPDGGATFSVELSHDRAPGEGAEIYFECADLEFAGRTWRAGKYSEHGWGDRLSGVETFSRWLFRDDLLEAVRAAGFPSVEVVREYDLPGNFPFIWIIAER